MKLKKIMRKCIYLYALVFSFVFTYASGQSTKVNINLNDATLVEIFDALSELTDYQFSYGEFVLKNKSNYNVKHNSESLKNILGELSVKASFEYRIDGKIINVKPKKSTTSNTKATGSAIGQDLSISGTILDETGVPLPGVSVIEKGTTNGAATGFDGKYALTVSTSNAILVVSYIGYKTQEIPVVGKSTIDIQMEPDTSQLDEVVVVGYTAQKVKDLTGAVNVVKLDGVESQSIASIDQALQGRTAGAQITGDGSPGGGVSVRIRGYGTLGNNDPLYVIDGVPTKSGLNQFNINDIESMQILKDAAATAIYGSRAANGVVIITTKGGKFRETRSLTFDTYTGIQSATNLPDMLNTQQYADLLWKAQRNSGLVPNNEVFGNDPNGPVVPEFLPNQFDQPIQSSVPGTNWFDELFQSSILSYYNLGYQQGSENSRMAFSGSYLNQNGVMKYSGFERYTARINSEFKTDNEIVTIGENLSYSYSERTSFATNSALGSRIIHAYRMNPIVPVRDINGDWASSVVGVQGAENPLALNYFDRNDLDQTSRVFGNVYAKITPVKGLVFKTDFGLDYEQLNRDNYNPRFTMGDAERPVNSYSKTSRKTTNWIWNNTLSYNKSIGDHTFTALVGTEAIKFRLDVFGASRENFFIDNLDYIYLNTGGDNQQNFGSGTQWSLFSTFGRLDYAFSDRYLLGASIRRDGSSRFGKNNRYAVFPAFSMGWRLSSEEFFKGEFFDDLKLRASWGQSGNQEIGDFASFSSYGTNSNSTNYDILGQNTSVITGFSESTIGNEDIVWETTTQTNIGLDATFWDRRMTLTLDYYIKDTDDILLQRPTLAVEGQAEPPFVNAGKMRNSGFEFQLGYNEYISDDFSINASINGAFIRNKVLELAGDVAFIPGFNDNASTRNLTISRTLVGEPIAQFYGHIVDGIFNSQEQVDNHADQPGKGLGRLIYRDLNNDGMIDNDDRQIIGSPHPDFVYGFDIGAKYKQFDVSLFFQGVQGVDLYNFTRYYTDFFYDSGNRHARVLDSWSPTNPNTTIPRLSAIDVNNELRPSTYFVEDGSFLRFKNFQVGYTFKFGKQKQMNARLYLQGNNLLTFTKYEGIDPEVSLASYENRNRNLDLGVDRGIYPNNRTISIGINTKF